MAETVTPPSKIARDEGTVETTATTTFRSLSSPTPSKASGYSARIPVRE